MEYFGTKSEEQVQSVNKYSSFKLKRIEETQKHRRTVDASEDTELLPAAKKLKKRNVFYFIFNIDVNSQRYVLTYNKPDSFSGLAISRLLLKAIQELRYVTSRCLQMLSNTPNKP